MAERSGGSDRLLVEGAAADQPVSALEQFEGEKTGEGNVVQTGRQWFAEGGSDLKDMSVRIQQSLSRLETLLPLLPSDPPPPTHDTTRYGAAMGPTVLDGSPDPPRFPQVVPPMTPRTLFTTPSPGATATPLGDASMMDLLKAQTPAIDMTSLHAGPHSSQQMDDTFRDSTMVDDPASKVPAVTRDLVLAFHREFSSHSGPSQCLDMAMALEKCCEAHWSFLSEFKKQTRCSVDQLLSELRLELDTWRLFHMLARDRVEGEEQRPLQRVGGGTLISDKQLVEQLFIQDSSVRQAQLVVDWLEGVARVEMEENPAKAAYFTGSVYWEHTLHDLSHGINSDLLVTEMDPDAPTRQHRKLSELDARDEKALHKHVFTCLRAGQLEKGFDMCRKSGKSAKVLMLQGWKFHHDPNIDKRSCDELEPIEGNAFRDVWKNSVWMKLNAGGCDVYEAALFAALTGNITKILPVCHTWYDQVWGYYKTLVDVQVEKALRTRSPPSGEEWVELPAKYWSNVLLPHQIFQEIEASASAEIRHQFWHSHFHVIQEYIILDDLIGLVDQMYTWLQGPTTISIHGLRFMAHIGLVVKHLGRLREESKVHAILEAYVKALTDGHFQFTVAVYAAQLPTDTQVKSYANLLAGVHEEEDQRYCLQLGQEAGLDMAKVIKALVEMEMGKEVDIGLVELGEEMNVKLTELDLRKIKAIKWLMYEEAHRAEAIKQGNALVRQFLTARKFSAAVAVFQTIPPDSPELVERVWKQKAGLDPLPQDIVSDLTEYQALQTYLKAKDAFNVWFQYFHHKKPAMPQEPDIENEFRKKLAYEYSLSQYKLEYQQWESQANFLAEEAFRGLHAVLVFPGGWMKGHIEVVPAPSEGLLQQQLEVLRKICIPEVCFLFHALLHQSGHYKNCLQLSDVVASDEHLLYKDFRRDELRQLLSLMRRSALCLTSDPSTDELGYPR